MRKPQEVERLWSPQTRLRSSLSSEPPKLDQPGLAPVDRQAELHQPVSECRGEPFPIRFLLTADRQVVRISTNDDLTGC